ncbi:MAG: DUF3098 domain-containing protein [Bacteroides sp.]|nr:DUF3098 domain-containing protein [Bacteroides sp.]
MAYKPASKRENPESRLLTESDRDLPLLRINFILMAIAGVMIILGFCLMAGGATDWDSFNPDIFSTRRIVVGPTIAFLGFLFMGFGIMYSPKRKNDKE